MGIIIGVFGGRGDPAAGDYDGGITYLNVRAERRPAVTLPHAMNDPVRCLTYAGRDGPLIAAASGAIGAWDARGQALACIGTFDLVALAPVFGTPVLISLDRWGALCRWTSNPLARVGEVRLKPKPSSLAVSSDGRLLATGHSSGAVQLWDIANVFGEG